MRVLLTTDTVGGVWTFTKELASELLQQGHIVAMISFGRQPLPSQLAWCTSLEQVYGTRFRYVPTNIPLEWMQQNNDSYSRGADAIVELAVTFEPDIAHVSQFCYGSLPVAVPVVITAHSDVLSWAAACVPAGLEESAWLLQYKAIVSQGLSGASAVVAPTQWMLDALRSSVAFSAPVRVIFNGRSFSPPVPSGSRKLQAVSVGRLWDPAKNVALLCAIRCPMPLVIAGENHDEKLPTGNHSFEPALLGHLSETDLLILFCSSSIYIAASIYEPFGLAPLEAALCGCAVIAHDIPSLREIWGDSVLYFHDAFSLEDTLAKLQDSPAFLAEMRARAFRQAQELSSVRMTDQYIDLYRNLLAARELACAGEQVAHAS